MPAPSVTILVFGMLIGKIGTESESSSVQDSIKSLNQKVLRLEDSVEHSIPQTIKEENEQTLLTILDKMFEDSKNYARTNVVSAMGETMRKAFQALSLRMEQMNLKLSKLSSQSEDPESSCDGEPPSLQNGKPGNFARKHGSHVAYQCDRHFDQVGNSTVRCDLGKWKGEPPDCRFWDTTFTLRVHLNPYLVSKVSCYSDENDQKIEFSRLLDTGTGGALPSGAKTYSLGKTAVLDLSGLGTYDRGGAYQCGYESEGKRTEIPFLIHGSGRFSWPRWASIGDKVEFMYFSSDDPSWRWVHDGERIPSADGKGKLTIAEVGADDAGIYEMYMDGDRRKTQAFFRLVVRGCPAEVFGEGCYQACPTCLNGGSCHDLLGMCVCPPGFEGSTCEVACGENPVGPKCSVSCDGRDCKGRIFCKPDPYGCSCSPGYRDYYCDIRRN